MERTRGRQSMKTTITIDTTAVTPTVFLFVTHGDFMQWIANETKVNIPVLDLQLAKSGTYQFTERHVVTTLTGVSTVYSYTFPTPQQHPTKQYTFTTWAVVARDVDSAITEN